MTERLKVELRNFNIEEGKCSCGCGKITAPELMLRLQAFIFYLESIYICPIRCLITGGARCNKHQLDVYGGKKVESYHCGPRRGKVPDPEGWATDVIVEIKPRDSWVRIAKHQLAEHAINSKLFGGVGWQIYGPASGFLHLDMGPVRTF